MIEQDDADPNVDFKKPQLNDKCITGLPPVFGKKYSLKHYLLYFLDNATNAGLINIIYPTEKQYVLSLIHPLKWILLGKFV